MSQKKCLICQIIILTQFSLLKLQLEFIITQLLCRRYAIGPQLTLLLYESLRGVQFNGFLYEYQGFRAGIFNVFLAQIDGEMEWGPPTYIQPSPKLFIPLANFDSKLLKFMFFLTGNDTDFSQKIIKQCTRGIIVEKNISQLLFTFVK